MASYIEFRTLAGADNVEIEVRHYDSHNISPSTGQYNYIGGSSIPMEYVDRIFDEIKKKWIKLK